MCVRARRDLCESAGSERGTIESLVIHICTYALYAMGQVQLNHGLPAGYVTLTTTSDSATVGALYVVLGGWSAMLNWN